MRLVHAPKNLPATGGAEEVLAKEGAEEEDEQVAVGTRQLSYDGLKNIVEGRT